MERWLPAGLIGALALAYLAYIHAFGVNVPFWDDWTLGQYFFALTEGRIGIGDLLVAKNNEHLVGVAFTLMILFHWLTGYDAKSILYLGAVFQLVTLALLLALAWPLLARRRWRAWHAVVLALLVLSLAPTQNILWGFQTAWNLITLLFFVALWFLARAAKSEPSAGTRPVVVAALCATLASFSSAQGLMVWPAGAVFLAMADGGGLRALVRDRRIRLWVILGIACAGLYGWVFLRSPTPHLAPPEAFESLAGNPLAVGRFMLAIMGTVLGDRLGASRAELVGAAVSVLCASALIAGILAKRRTELAFPAALLAFGLLCTLMIAVGRLPFGQAAAIQSRYATIVLIALAGAYLTMVLISQPERYGPGHRFLSRGIVLVAVGAFIVSSGRAIAAGREWRLDRSIGAMVLLNADREPRFKIERTLCWNADIVMQQFPKLRARSLSSFAKGSAGYPAAADYAAPPAAFMQLIESRPEERAALERLWGVYVAGSDLRSRFPLTSPTLTPDLVRWAAQAAGGDHYLAKYLREFGPDYARLLAGLGAPAGQGS